MNFLFPILLALCPLFESLSCSFSRVFGNGSLDVLPTQEQPGALSYLAGQNFNPWDGKIYLLGLSYGRNDIWSFNPHRHVYTLVFGVTSGAQNDLNGPVPAARKAFDSTFDPNRQEILIFGGFTSDGSRLGDLWAWSVGKKVWKFLSGRRGIGSRSSNDTGTAVAGTRVNHAMDFDAHGDTLFMYGGYGLPMSGNSKGRLNELWSFDREKLVWKWLFGSSFRNQEETPSQPGVRTLPGLIGEMKMGRVLLVGGAANANGDSNYKEDVWEFSLLLFSWKKLYGSSDVDLEESEAAPGGWGTKISGIMSRVSCGTYSVYIMKKSLWSFSLAMYTWTRHTPPADEILTYNLVLGDNELFGFANIPSNDVFRICQGGFCDSPVCFPGSRRNESGQCQDCAVGYGSGFNQTFCEICRPGTFSFDACKSCPAGRFTSEEGLTDCTVCSSGTWSLKGSSLCEHCVAGRFSTGTSCVLCDSGKFAANASTFCQSCPKGYYADRSGQAECQPCVSGTVAFSTGSNLCQECSSGKHSAKAAASSVCLTCQTAQYAASRSSACFSCGGSASSGYNSSLPAGSISDCFCNAGYYGRPFLGEKCVPCTGSLGVTCPAKSSLPIVAKGFSRSARDPSVAYECIPFEACPFESFGSETTCGEGYFGVNCAACDPGKYFRLGNFCRECSWLSSISIVIFLIGVFIVLWLVLKRSVPDIKSITAYSIILYWVQSLDLLIPLRSDWPQTINWLFVLASSLNFNFDILSPECSFEVSYWDRWHIKMTALLLLGAMQLIYFVVQENPYNSKRDIFVDSASEKCGNIIHKAALVCEGRNEVGAEDVAQMPEETSYLITESPYRYSRYVFSYGIIQSSLYTLIASTSMEMFQCVPQSDGVYLMAKNTAQQCFDSFWWQMLFSNIVFASITLIYLPLNLYFVLRAMRLLREADEVTGIRNNFGSFIIPYRTEVYWWPVFLYCHRLIFVFLVNVVAFYQSALGFLLLSMWIIVYIILVMVKKPYNEVLNIRQAALYEYSLPDPN